MGDQHKGWRNNYRASMPASERMLKDLRSFTKDVGMSIRHGGKLRTIVTYPDYPSKRTTIQKIARKMGWRLTNKPLKSADIILFFEDTTHKDTSTDDFLTTAEPVLNLACTDISKERVEEVHQSVFGYGTFIDPLTFEGTAVEKSDENAKHDGHYIQCPIAQVTEGCIYQRVLSNRNEEGLAVDHRVPVMGSEIPLTYLKKKEWEVRFTNEVTTSSLHTPESLFNAEELQLITEFTAAIHAEFCELDIIRDNNDGRIYIIDVNTTPYGPPAGLDTQDRLEAISLLSSAFQKAFLSA